MLGKIEVWRKVGGANVVIYFSPVTAGREVEGANPCYQNTSILRDGDMANWWDLRDPSVEKNVLRLLFKCFWKFWDIVGFIIPGLRKSVQCPLADQIHPSASTGPRIYYKTIYSREWSNWFYFASSDEALKVFCWPRWVGCHVLCVHLGMLTII